MPGDLNTPIDVILARDAAILAQIKTPKDTPINFTSCGHCTDINCNGDCQQAND